MTGVPLSYLRFSYSGPSSFSGPSGLTQILAEYADVFDLDIKQWTIDDFGGWDNAYEDFFDDGAKFDEIYDY